MQHARKLPIPSHISVIVSLALLPLSIISTSGENALGSPRLLQEPPFSFPTETFPSRQDCDAYLAEVQSMSPATELLPPESNQELNFEIGAENCLLGLVSENPEAFQSDLSAGPVSVTIDDALAGRICASIQRERSKGSACTDSRSDSPMMMVFRAYPQGEHPYDIVIVDPLRRLGTARGLTAGNAPFEGLEAQDQGLWMHLETWEPPDSLEVSDTEGVVIGGFSNRSERFPAMQQAANLANELPAETE